MGTTASGIWFPEKGQSYDLNVITSTMASSIEAAVGPKVKDSDWVTLQATSRFPLYGTTPIQVRNSGGVVNLNGAVKPSVAGQLSGTICTLPVGSRPKTAQYFVCQGSGNDKWTLMVYPSGNVDAGRYGPGTPTTSTWLPFSATFIAG